MPLVKRRFFISCKEEECIKLYEFVKDRLPALSYVELTVTSKGLLVEIYGYESDIKTAWMEIRKIIKSIREVSSTRGLKRYSVEFITQVTKKTFSPELLVEIIKRLGYRAVFLREENTLLSDMDFNNIVILVERIAEQNTMLAKISKNTSTRYYLVACAVLTGLPIEDIIKISRDLDLLFISEDGKVALKSEWKSSLNKFYKNFKPNLSSHMKSEGS